MHILVADVYLSCQLPPSSCQACSFLGFSVSTGARRILDQVIRNSAQVKPADHALLPLGSTQQLPHYSAHVEDQLNNVNMHISRFITVRNATSHVCTPTSFANTATTYHHQTPQCQPQRRRDIYIRLRSSIVGHAGLQSRDVECS